MSDIVDFNQFKKKKADQEEDFLDLSKLKADPNDDPQPFFKEATVITLQVDSDEEGPVDVQFQLIANLVYERHQYLALEEIGGEPGDISIVEAVIENGELVNVQVLPAGVYAEVVPIFEETLQQSEEERFNADD